jgi:hypothetical protein
MQEGRVIPLLLDIEFKDITGPLAQFQAKKVEKSGLEDVVNSINQVSDVKVLEGRLDQLFGALWPNLEMQVASIPKAHTPAKQNRPQHEVLEELVTSIRGLDQRFRDSVETASPRRRKRNRLPPGLISEMSHQMGIGPGDPVRVLMLTSLLRDDLPWLYELAVDMFRASGEGKQPRHGMPAFASQLRFV